ncbi:MAG: hypothetical protein H0X37_11945 [Herpetosiphonaceae bacterium]|nr:hypothetical protein [Herpetosiphonaceae bacterium]
MGPTGHSRGGGASGDGGGEAAGGEVADGEAAGGGESGPDSAADTSGTQSQTGNSAEGGRAGKQARLRAIASDDKASSSDRGWVKQEINQIDRGTRNSIRVPPGKVLAHRRGFEARSGFGYEYSDLQDADLHRLQHHYEGYK